jgi:hypothetical protein
MTLATALPAAAPVAAAPPDAGDEPVHILLVDDQPENQGVRDHSGTQEQPDDMTAIVIKVESVPAPGAGGAPSQALADTVPDFAMLVV